MPAQLTFETRQIEIEDSPQLQGKKAPSPSAEYGAPKICIFNIFIQLLLFLRLTNMTVLIVQLIANGIGSFASNTSKGAV